MSSVPITKALNDPVIPNWKELELDDTWPDSLDLASFAGIWKFIKLIFGNRKPVKIPQNLPGGVNIPKYVLQEFHNLPNGNYSRRFSRGYITGFDISLIGYATVARGWIAERLKNCHAVVDVGTAGGKTGRAIKDAGVDEVWGVDPSPYLLKHAAEDHPCIKFVPGIAEDLPFEDKRLDGIAACFLFHEIPPKYARQAFESFNRVLQLGGKVIVAEPSEQQLEPFRLKEFFCEKGWLKIYFKALANFVHEPFLDAWHNHDKQALFENAGFKLVEQENGMPINYYHMEKVSDV